MQIGKLESQRISFKRALTKEEEYFSEKVLSRARKEVEDKLLNEKFTTNNNMGKSILIVHDSCLPQSAASDIGVGHLSSKTSSEFFDFAKNYLGINTIEVLPPGEIQLKHTKGFYNTYNGSALSLGTQQINLELLTEPKFNSILPKSEFEKVVAANKATQINGLVNYENVVGANSPQEKALRVAFNNFINNSSIDKTAYENYKAANADWLEPKSIYPILKEQNEGKNWAQWASEVDRNLFDGTHPDATKRLAEIKSNYANEIEFYKFKQYIADEHLKIGRQNINSKGMKLFGDCLIGFSDDETWAFKKAFKENCFIGDEGWKIPALDFSNITDSNSASQKLLKRKVGLFAKRYDGIRMDASWSYVKPKLSDGTKIDFEGSLLDIIDNTVKEVKGDKFNLSDIIHEFEADSKDFSIFDSDGTIVPYLKDRVKVVSSSHLSSKYGSVKSMMDAGANLDNIIVGVGNHDPQPLRQIAEDIPDVLDGKKYSFRRFAQEQELGKIFKKGHSAFATPADFAKMKFAEPLSGKNQMVFYMDVFGSAQRFDSQSQNIWRNYRQRIPEGFKARYLDSAAEGFAYNPSDGYMKIFKLYGWDKTKKDLYERLEKISRIISEKTNVVAEKTRKKVSDLSKNKFLNIGAVAAAVGLIGIVLFMTNKGLEKQKHQKLNQNA